MYFPVSRITWVRRFGDCARLRVGFDNVILSIEIFIANELYPNLTVVFLFNIKSCHILVFGLADSHFETDRVKITFHIVLHADVVYLIITVQIEVIDFRIFLIQLPLKAFECFRFLEKLQNRVKVEIIARKIELFFFGLTEGAVAGPEH